MPSTPYNNNSPPARGGMPLQPPPPPALLPDPPSTSRLTLRPHRHNPRRPRPVPLVSDLQLSELPSPSSPVFTPRGNGGCDAASIASASALPQSSPIVINTLIHLHISSFTPLSRRVKHDPQVVSVFLHPHLNAFDHHHHHHNHAATNANANENVPDSGNADRTVAAPGAVSAAGRARAKLKRHRASRQKDRDRHGHGQQQQQHHHHHQGHDHHGWTSVASISCLPAVISLPNTPTSYYLRLSFHNNKPSRHFGDATVPLHRVLHRPSVVVPITHRGSTIALIFLRATKTVLHHDPNRPQPLAPTAAAAAAESSSLHSHPSVSSPSLSAASADAAARTTRMNSSSAVAPSSATTGSDVPLRHSNMPASNSPAVFPSDALALVSLSNSVCCHQATPAAAAAADANGAQLSNASPPWQRAGLSLAVRIAGSMATDARLVTAVVLSVAKGKHGKPWPAGRAALSKRAGRTACISAPADVLWFGVDSPRGDAGSRHLGERGRIKDAAARGNEGGCASDDDEDDDKRDVDDEGWFKMEWISLRKQGAPFVHGSLKLGIKQLVSLDKGQLLLMDWIEACGTPVVERTACIEHAAFRDGFWFLNLFLTR